jgi:hypothetical protein
VSFPLVDAEHFYICVDNILEHSFGHTVNLLEAFLTPQRPAFKLC